MPKTKDAPRKTLPAGIGKVLKRLHHLVDVIVLCVRWYVAYSLSLRNLEEMMAERGIEVDHSSVHRWVIKSCRCSKRRFDGASDRLARVGGWTKPMVRPANVARS
jgi:transposase-like protein